MYFCEKNPKTRISTLGKYESDEIWGNQLELELSAQVLVRNTPKQFFSRFPQSNKLKSINKVSKNGQI
jgi:hypothetical protein